jgi:hypothetical protein
VRARLALGVLGVAATAYGAWLLLSRQDLDAVVEVAIWFAVGVVAHDGVIALLVLGAGAALVRTVPRVARAPLAVGAVVLSSVTLLAVPVLGRLGARPDNTTLLDRPYLAGWAVLAGLVAVAVALATLVRGRRGRAGEESDGGTGAGG